MYRCIEFKNRKTVFAIYYPKYEDTSIWQISHTFCWVRYMLILFALKTVKTETINLRLALKMFLKIKKKLKREKDWKYYVDRDGK